jgi:hypothetical protein
MARSHDDTVWVFVLAFCCIALVWVRIGALTLLFGWLRLAGINFVPVWPWDGLWAHQGVE